MIYEIAWPFQGSFGGICPSVASAVPGYQGAPKAVGNYVEIVGLQKLLGLSASLVAIGANPLDFFLAASPSSHHPHRPPGTGQFMGSFSPNVFLFTGTFFRKTFSDRKQGASLRSNRDGVAGKKKSV